MDKKKTIEKKNVDKPTEINKDISSHMNVINKNKKGTTNKIPNEKEIKLEEETLSEDNIVKSSLVSSTKSSNNKLKKSTEIYNPNTVSINLNSTPKSGKVPNLEKTQNLIRPHINSFNMNTTIKSPQIKIPEKKINQNSLTINKITSTNNIINLNVNKSPHSNTKEEKIISKKLWYNNTNTLNIFNNLENYIKDHNKEKLTFSFNKINSLKNVNFYQKFLQIKKHINELISNENELNEYHPLLLKYIDSTLTQINTKLNKNNFPDSTMSSNLNHSAMSDDGLVDSIYYKNNSVAFEIPITYKRERAMSDFGEKSHKSNWRLFNRSRLSSEEVENRMRKKLEKAERNKNVMRQNYQENINKLMNKINDIKQKKKKSKQENMQKLVDKLERYNIRHQEFLNQKIRKAKIEQEKVAEVNFINRMGKQDRDLSIIKKLNISIERRENYMIQKLNKTIQRNQNSDTVEKKRKFYEDELKNKVMKRIEKNQKKNNDEDKLKVDNKILIVNQRKHQMENEIEFLKNVYSENFIWELLQADCFDVDVLNNLTNLTKFEILKAKLKKDKDYIDILFEKKDKSKLSTKTKIGNMSETILSTENENNNFCINEISDDNSDKEEKIKRSKSFTMFDQNDYFEVDYLFKDSQKKKRKRKKKKPEIIKNRIIKSINSMSQTDLSMFFSKINKDKNMKKFLIKSKNGIYIKSKIIVTNEELVNKTNLENPIDTLNTIEKENFNFSISDDNDGVIEINSDKEISFEDRKEKFIRDIVQNNHEILSKNENNQNGNTIIINSESLQNILEQNAITVKWCKLCNMILPNDQDTNFHISKQEHKRLKVEYGISLQDDSTFIMVFQSLPGDISEDFKNERINAIKHRLKKVKQKMSLRAIKHENFWSYKQDFPSNNKQRLQKISFDVEKQTLPNIKDYESLENNLKDLIKILEQKKQNDLHIMRGLKIIHCLVEILKKPAVCHKSEIKNLGKIIELVIKILMYFSTIIENRNYMVVTNRMSVVADILLWVLNKPSKIPLGISFLPDIIYLITIHIKHRIPFEYLAMKDDFLEYLCLSNILIKFRQKYTSMIGPIDLTSGFGSFPLVLLKSLGMIEALTFQININYCTKPVYVKNSKISENILFVLEYTELVGIIQLVTTLLLCNGPVKPKSDNILNNNSIYNGPIPVLPQTVISSTILGVKVLNNIARLDLTMFQNVCNYSLVQEQLYHTLTYIINYSLEYIEGSDDLKELLHETILMINYCALFNEKFQNILSRGEVTVIQRLCSLPFSYFCEKKLKDILFPTILSITYKNERNLNILNKEINLELIIIFIKEKIQLEPIIEEELDESREEVNFNMIKMSKDQFVTNQTNETAMMNENVNRMKKRTMSFSSTASSTKSCHDMLTGVSDYIPFYHRFPRDMWENALDYYINFNK